MDDSFTYMSGSKRMIYFNVQGVLSSRKGHLKINSLDQVSPSEMVETVRSSSSGTRSGRSFFSPQKNSQEMTTPRQLVSSCAELMEKFCHF